MTQKLAFITGITGQDGSYLAELLLEKGYIVHGIVRRNSALFTYERIEHIREKINLHYGDMADFGCMLSILNGITQEHPDFATLEVYNLAAQSHVAISFENPEYTADVDGVGVLRLLEVIRSFPLSVRNRVRFYQASTSELYGDASSKEPMTETTPFNPVSPYAAAKLYAYYITKIYREGYGMFACTGTLFNHETVAANTPMIFTHDKINIDIKSINEIVNYHTRNEGVLVDETNYVYQEGNIEKDLYVWDASGWTKVTFASGYKHDISGNPKNPSYIVSKNSCYMATGTHHIIMEDNSEKEVKDILIGDKVKLTTLDSITNKDLIKDTLSDFEAEFMGLIVGDGYIGKDNRLRFINSSEVLRNYAAGLWQRICNKYNQEYIAPRYYPSKSGFSDKIVGYIDFYGKWYLNRSDFYNLDKTKRVPKIILNSSPDIQYSFLKGYNMADGLKANKCVSEFKNFKTNSAVLACGLIYLIDNTTKQNFNVNLEHKIDKEINRFYYSINLESNSRFSKSKSQEKKKIVEDKIKEGIPLRQIQRDTGISRKFIQNVDRGIEVATRDRLAIDNNNVKKIKNYYDYDGWFYDLETESGTFFCGVGKGIVHNSPKRGANFVTQKIINSLKEICEGKRTHVELGNINSMRDWGHAKDYVQAMWLMLQQEKPDDFVIATGKTYSVRDFIERSFSKKGFQITWEGEGLQEVGKDQNGYIRIKISEKYYRPCEVEYLLGSAEKAERILGWKPTYNLDALIDDMLGGDNSPPYPLV